VRCRALLRYDVVLVSPPTRKVLVTGGSGFIGSRLVRRLLSRGIGVTILDLVVREEFASRTVQGDVADPAAVHRAMQGVDLVLNLAAQHRDDVFPVELYYKTNVDGMRVLCEGMDEAGVRRMMFTSSVAIYGFDTQDGDEATPPAPANHYGKSKLEAEQVLRDWLARGGGRSAAIMRPCAVFGPSNRGNIFNLFRQVMSGRFLMVGDGRNRKSMAFVDNVVEAILFMMDRPGTEVVNYADKPDLPMNELVELICRSGGRRAPRVRLPKWAGMAAGRALDVVARLTRRTFPLSAVRITKFCATSVVNADRIRRLGFVPPRTLADGIKETLESEFRVRPRTLIVNQAFWPDNVATAQHCHDLAKHLAASGHDVTVIACRSRYDGGKGLLPRRETVDGIHVIRVGRSLFDKRRVLARSVDFLTFVLLSTVAALRRRRFDVVVCCTTPPFIGVAGLLVTRLRGGALVLWMMDLYPEVAIAVGLLREGSPACEAFRAIDRACLSRADAVVVLGDRMRERLSRKGCSIRRIETINVWSDGDEIQPQPAPGSPLRARWGLEGKFVIQYSGNFGLGHEGRTIFDAMEALRDDPVARWLFVGGGRKRSMLDRFLAGSGVSNVESRPYQARDALSATLAVGDVHLVSMDADFAGIIVPSKFYGALAAGRPVLYVGPRRTEIADTIEQLDCGVVVEPGHPERLVAAIRRLASDPALVTSMGARARAGFESRFSRRIACDRWGALLAEIAARPGGKP
jgi:nucleoside-diphosphate-sugar epimerase/glycosyltransferase involved in cell wall biosynthesis